MLLVGVWLVALDAYQRVSPSSSQIYELTSRWKPPAALNRDQHCG